MVADYSSSFAQGDNYSSKATAGQGEGHSADGTSNAKATNFTNETHESHGGGPGEQYSSSRTSSTASEHFESSSTTTNTSSGTGMGNGSQQGGFGGGNGGGLQHQSENAQGNAGEGFALLPTLVRHHNMFCRKQDK